MVGGSQAQRNGGSSFKLERKAGSSFRWDKETLRAFAGCEAAGSGALLALGWQLGKLGHAFGNGAAHGTPLGATPLRECQPATQDRPVRPMCCESLGKLLHS